MFTGNRSKSRVTTLLFYDIINTGFYSLCTTQKVHSWKTWVSGSRYCNENRLRGLAWHVWRIGGCRRAFRFRCFDCQVRLWFCKMLFVMSNRQHAEISFVDDMDCFCITCLHPTGMFVDGELKYPHHGRIFLHTKTIIQVLHTTALTIIFGVDWLPHILLYSATTSGCLVLVFGKTSSILLFSIIMML